MATEVTKSAIREVRDQLGLDTADGKYLNIVSSNLGIPRPAIGYSDELWRALVKAIALDHKQVITQFHTVLEIFFGPRTTKTASLSADAAMNDTEIVLNDVTHLPQRGTMVLDEGLGTEETRRFCLIDRETNTVYLNDPLEYSHVTMPFDDEKDVLLVSGSKLFVSDVAKFPNTTPQYTVVVGSGTINEEVALVDSVDSNDRSITLSAPLTNTHTLTAPSTTRDSLLVGYFATSILLHLSDTDEFPDEGNLLLGPSSNTFTETVGSATQAVAPALSFTATRHAGFIARFDGNITAALVGVEIPISANTTDTLTFEGTLPVPSAAGDTFTIRPVLGYRFVDRDTGTLTLYRSVTELALLAGTTVELLDAGSTVSVGEVQLKGAAWDVFQSDPKNVEVLLPTEVLENDLRSASYVHNVQLSPTPSTTLSVGTAIGATSFLPATAIDTFPVAGVLVFDPGGFNEEHVGYYTETKYSMVPAVIDSTGAPYSPIEFVDGGAAEDSIVRSAGSFLDDGFAIGQTVVVSGATLPANDVTATLISVSESTLTVAPGTLTADAGNLTVAIETQDRFLVATSAPLSAHLAAEVIELYQPVYAGTDLLDGRFRTTIDLWPGPYLYQTTSEAPNAAMGVMVSQELLAGPTQIAMRPSIGNTSVEVKDATAFPLTGFPYSFRLGAGAGNEETIQAFGVALKQRTYTTTSGIITAGDLTIPMTTLAPIAVGGTFPNAKGYRVLIDGTEVVYVTGTAAGPVLTIESPIVSGFGAGVDVELLDDVIHVDGVTDGHSAYIDDYNNRSTATAAGLALNPPVTSVHIGRAELAQVWYPDLVLDAAVSLAASGGEVLVNYAGNQVEVENTLNGAAVATSTTLALDDSAGFPEVFPYVIVLSPGKYVEERVLVTAHNTGLNQLTLDSPLRRTHADENKVRWTPGTSEVLTYSSVSGTTLSFSSLIVVQSTHSPSELVLASNANSIPRNNGYDFPFRMPADITQQINTILDRLRAAGIQVTYITQR